MWPLRCRTGGGPGQGQQQQHQQHKDARTVRDAVVATDEQIGRAPRGDLVHRNWICKHTEPLRNQIAREADVPFTIEDIQRIGEGVPLIANLQPHGAYAMVSLHNVGGVPVVMKALLEAGYLHGDVMTVTGKTLAENSRGLYPIPRDGVTSAQRWCRYEEGRPKAPSSTYLGYSASLKVMKLARP